MSAAETLLYVEGLTVSFDGFRALDSLNERLMEAVNRSGEVFLSHTRLDGRYALRLAVCHIRTTERHVARAWELLRKETESLAGP